MNLEKFDMAYGFTLHSAKRITDILMHLLCVIYCQKQFDVINYVTFHWMTFRIMQFAILQCETKLQKCIRIEINIFNFSFREVYHHVCWEITFYCSADVVL